MKDDHELFTIISLISNSTHGLLNHNRKFYFNAFENRLLPIYYDGDSTLGWKYNDFNEIVNVNDTIDFSDPLVIAISNQLNKDNIIYSINKLKDIDLESFTVKLNRSGINIESFEVKEMINSLIENANSLKVNENTSNSQKIQIGPNILYKDIPIDFGLAFMSKPFKVDLCDKDMINCKERILTSQELRQLSKGELSINGKRYFYRYSSLDKYINNINVKDKNKEYKTIKINDLINLRLYGNPLIDINIRSKLIRIKTVTPRDKVVFHDSYLDGWNIQIDSKESAGSNQNKPRIDKNLLTGLVTIKDSEINNIDISVANGIFEDSLNIMRSQGSINTIDIKNSYADAVDFDFSDLEIDQILIKNAGNDCIDLSGGKYYINKVEAYGCRDKGVSIGENSNTLIELAIIENAKTGLVSKDSSTLVVKEGTIKESSVCLSAYRKKQEFSGGYAQLNKGICEEGIIKVQENSIIEYK